MNNFIEATIITGKYKEIDVLLPLVQNEVVAVS